MLRGRSSFAVLAVAFVIFLSAIEARAAVLLNTYSFYSVTNTSLDNAAIGEAQLILEVYTVDDKPHQVAFVFKNEGPDTCSITDIYFSDGTLLEMAPTLDAIGDVDFPNNGARPHNLPGFSSTADFGIDSSPPTYWNGINNTGGESLTIVFDLQTPSGGTNPYTAYEADDALRLGGPYENKDGVVAPLTVGLHVQGFVGDGSESFVHDPTPSSAPSTVPEPTALAVWSLLGAGTAAGAAMRRRRRGWSQKNRQAIYELLDPKSR